MSAVNPVWASLEKELRPRVEAVGFRSVGFQADRKPDLPGVDYFAFEAPYALLYCVCVPAAEEAVVAGATQFACDTIKLALENASQSDWSRDGYVLLALAAKSEDDKFTAVLRAFEQNRSICRRHVLWPKMADQTWSERLDRVTVVSLPEAQISAASTDTEQSGPAFIETIHSRLKIGKPYRAIADELVRDAREKEDFHAP